MSEALAIPRRPKAADPVAARLERLRALYTEGLGATAHQFRAFQELPHLPLGTDGDLHRLAHRLSGSAGVFGHAEIGRRAAKLEQACSAQPMDAPKVRLLLDELIEALDAACGRAAP